MEDNVQQKVDKAIASINKGADKKEEMRMMMAPYADWDRFLAPAPLSIALLGQLILISSDRDFSLQDKDKTIKFKKLSYPDSFRACLVEVSNKGWGAFSKAHTCMDQIRLYSSNVEGHVRTAVKFLLAGSPQEVELMLPDALKSIENIADECVKLASSVENEFVFVMQIVAELLEACTRAKGEYEQKLKDTEIAMQVANEEKKATEEQKAMAEKKREEMMRQMKEAEEEYHEALESMPSTGDIVGLALAEGFIAVARNISSVVSMARGIPARASVGSKSEEDVTHSVASSSELQDQVKEVFNLATKARSHTIVLENIAGGGKNSQGKKEPKWNEIGEAIGGAQYRKQKLKRIFEELPKSELEIRNDLEKICLDGIKICENLLNQSKAMNKDDEEIEDVMNRATDLSCKVESVIAASQIALGGNSLPNKPPQLAKQGTWLDEGNDGGLVKSALQSARLKTETAKEMLKDSRKMYDKACDDVTKRMEKMGKVLAELAKFNLEKIDYETIRDTLIKGIKALAALREQWGKLVQFFQMLSSLVKCCLDSSLKKFVSTSRNQKKLSEAGNIMSDTMRDVIFEQASQANQIAYIVKSISSVYVQVSEEHLMNRITCLGKLIALDPDKDAHEIRAKREELNQGCEEAQEAIKRIANEKKKKIMEAFDQRIGRIKREVEALMPPISEADVKEIQDRAKTAVAKGNAAIQQKIDDLV